MATMLIFRQLSLLSLIALCLYLCWLAVSWGLADREANNAHQILSSWEKGTPFSRDALATAINHNRAAISLDPNNARYRNRIARLLLIKLIVDDDTEAGQEALDHLRHARAIRPAYAGSYAIFAETKYRLNEFDTEMFESIELATQKGPWEEQVLQIITRTGLASYGSLPKTTQNAVIKTIARGLSSPVHGLPRRVFSIMKEEVNGWTLEFVASLVDTLKHYAWPSRSTAIVTELSVLLWPLLSEKDKTELPPRLSELIAGSSSPDSALRIIADARLLPHFCPWLPRDQVFSRRCAF